MGALVETSKVRVTCLWRFPESTKTGLLWEKMAIKYHICKKERSWPGFKAWETHSHSHSEMFPEMAT